MMDGLAAPKIPPLMKMSRSRTPSGYVLYEARPAKPHSSHETPGRLTKQSNQLYFPHQDDCNTIMDIK